MDQTRARRYLQGDDERDLRWFFREANGDMGLHGANLEPDSAGGSGGDTQVARHARMIVMCRDEGPVARWRGIRDRLESLTRDAREALALAYGPPIPSAPYNEFGELLAPLVSSTPTAIRRGAVAAEKRAIAWDVAHPEAKRLTPIRVDAADIHAAINRACLAGGRDRFAINAMRSDAETRLKRSCEAYESSVEHSEPTTQKQIRAWAGR